jgi:hypothetical protein
VAKLLSELDIVRRNIDIMSEIMSENEPGKESQDDYQLLEELNRSVHSMQSRVADLIERCQDEIILESTLQINDELNSVFVRYERYLGNREALQQASQEGAVQPQVKAGGEGGVATTSLSEVSIYCGSACKAASGPLLYAACSHHLVPLPGRPTPSLRGRDSCRTPH